MARDGSIRSRDKATGSANRRVIASAALYPEHVSPVLYRWLRDGLLRDAPGVLERYHGLPGGEGVEACTTGGDDTEYPPSVPPRATDEEYGSAAMLDSGRVLYAWAAGGAIQLGEIATFEEFVTEPSTIITGTDRTVAVDGAGTLDGLADPSAAVFRLPDGRLMLHAGWKGRDGDGQAYSALYRSPDEGASWQLHVALSAAAGSSSSHAGVGVPTRTTTGRLVLPGMWADSGPWFAVYTSDDGGDTWTRRLASRGGFGSGYNSYHGRTIAEWGGALWACYTHRYGGYYLRVFRSTDDGSSWTQVYEYRRGDGPWATGAHSTTGDPFADVTFYTDSADPGRLYAIGMPYGTGSYGYVFASSDPASAHTWNLHADPSFPRGGGGDVGSSRQPMAQQVGDRRVLLAGGYATLIGSPLDLLPWRGHVLRAAGGLPAYCVRVDTGGRLQTRSLDGHTRREFAYRDEIAEGGGAAYLGHLLDVDVAGRSDGDALVWDTAAERWVPGAGAGDHEHAGYAATGHELDSHADVDAADPADGDTLTWQASAAAWVPQAAAGGGGGQVGVRAASPWLDATGSLQLDLAVPSTVEAGDMLAVAIWQRAGEGLVAAPAGYTLAAAETMPGDTTTDPDSWLEVWAKEAEAADAGATHTFTRTADGHGGYLGQLVALAAPGTIGVEGTATGATSGSSDAHTIPSVYAEGDGRLKFGAAACAYAQTSGDTTFTFPTGWDQHSPASVGANRLAVGTLPVDAGATDAAATDHGTGTHDAAMVAVLFYAAAADHDHDPNPPLTDDAAAALGGTASAGTASEAARADHVHPAPEGGGGGGGTGGGSRTVEEQVLAASATAVQLQVPADLREFYIEIVQPQATSAGPNYAYQFNGDGGANYAVRRWNSYSSVEVASGDVGAPYVLVLRASGDVSSPQVLWAAVQQPADDEPAFLQGRVDAGADNLGFYSGLWLKGAGERIATVDLLSAFGDPIPAGTRVRLLDPAAGGGAAAAGAGQATIPDGADTVLVAHGLAATPAAIVATPHADARVWVPTRGASEFTAARAGTTGPLAFDWTATP